MVKALLAGRRIKAFKINSLTVQDLSDSLRRSTTAR
jgi:hypothetical protein